MSAELLSTSRRVVPAGHWQLLADRSSASFAVRNFGVGSVVGTIHLREGTVQVDASGVVARVQARLDLDGLDTRQWRRDLDLRRPQLLDVQRHPDLTFDATVMTPTADGGWAIPGRLAVRGTSVPLTLAVDPAGPDEDEVELRASATLDRRELGIRVPRLLVGHLVRITLVTRWRRR